MFQLAYIILALITVIILGVVLFIACRHSFFCASIIHSCFSNYFVFDELSQNTAHLDNLTQKECGSDGKVDYIPGHPKSIHKIQV